jgi:hypothetical protein
MSKHTPTPWRVGDDRSTVYGPIGEYTSTIAKCERYGGDIFRRDNELGEENAVHIVRAINVHDELLEALEELVDLMEAVRTGEYKPDSFTTQPARAAIAKAKG